MGLKKHAKINTLHKAGGRVFWGEKNNEKLITHFICLQRKDEMGGIERQKNM